MGGIKNRNVTRRTLLKIGGAITTVPFVGFAAPGVLAQGQTKSPTKVLDFMTNADVAKAEETYRYVRNINKYYVAYSESLVLVKDRAADVQ